MIKTAVYNLEGKKVEDINLDESVFGVEKNDILLQQAYVSVEASKRKALAHTKNRSARSGSTRKPWAQKGTGRARTGSIRNPIWRKGGVTFGPTNERNYAKKINQKMAQKALKMALSDKLKEEKIIVVDSLNIEEKKTKNFDKVLTALKIEKKVLVSLSKDEQATAKVSRNIPIVRNVFVDQLNISDILNNTFCVISKQGIEVLQSRFVKGAEKEVKEETKKETKKEDKKEDKKDDKKVEKEVEDTNKK